MLLIPRILCVLAALFLLAGCEKQPEALSPNLILVSIDTLRADHLGCYGYDRPTSPTLDRLASEGMLFECAYATSPWTLPSHGTMLTGFYPGRIGLNSEDSTLPTELETLAMVLSKHSFSTAAVVNSFFVSEKYGFNRGFDYFCFVPENHAPIGAAPIIIKQAMQWVQQHKNEQFFLFLHFYDVHANYSTLPQYEEQFVGPYNGVADGTLAQLIEFRKGTLSLDKADVKHFADLYDAEIRQLDDQLKRLLGFLQQEALLEKSFMIITSDHGEEFLDHGGILHGRTQYQELIHIPLIIRGPGIPPSRRFKGIVSLLDMVPTVLSLLGISSPSGLEGLDLSPLWQDNRYKLPDRFIFSEADQYNVKNDIKRAVWHGKYKLHYDLLTKKLELYNLVNDPTERLNVASEYPSVGMVLLTKIKKFMMKITRDTQSVPLTPKEIEKLKSLGYL
ncbi:MAG: sulfatase [Deltaproteobacteria bacterium]|nr:sulfatase [Deltaproteobacteria bacterium]